MSKQTKPNPTTVHSQLLLAKEIIEALCKEYNLALYADVGGNIQLISLDHDEVVEIA